MFRKILTYPCDSIRAAFYRFHSKAIRKSVPVFAIRLPASKNNSLNNNEPYLFVVSDKKTESGKSTVDMVPVKLGISVDNNTEISEGVTAGVEVVVKGQSLLNQGDAVTVLAVVNEERK